jgi:adenylate cyclase
LTLCWFGAQIQQAIEERAKRRFIEGVFGNYVTPELRDYLLSAPEGLSMGGRLGRVTVMVVDLRGFTDYSQRRKPEHIMNVLNTLFQQMVPVVQQRQGLILRYTGDGFIALFGQPKPDADHALHAMQAAQEIARMAWEWRQSENEDLAFWSVGCSLASGEVAYGNLGAEERPEFTVIGNCINLAARLQDACKELKAAIIADRECYLEAGSPPASGSQLREVRGLDEPIEIYVVEYIKK